VIAGVPQYVISIVNLGTVPFDCAFLIAVHVEVLLS
jgi:hypothetical protein